MEAGLVLVPLTALMLLVLRMARRRRRTEVPPPIGPPRGGDLDGDRSPRHPRVPSLSGAAALPIPHDP